MSLYSPEVQLIMDRWEREQEAREAEFYARREREREEKAARLAYRPTRGETLKAMVDRQMRRRYELELGIHAERPRRPR